MKTEKVEKLVAKLQEKRIKKDRKKICDTNKKYKTSIKSWISIEKIHKVTKFNNITWLKS